MPTIFSALLSAHGALPAPARPPGVPERVPEFSRHLVSERVASPPITPRPGASVIVVGAGLAGLAAAHELAHAGYDVSVIEAQNKIAGRVESLYDVVPGKVVEGGGELIGDNHHAWITYAAKFGLSFTPVHDGENAPVILRGRRLRKKTAAHLLQEMDEVFNEMARLASQIQDPCRPWRSGAAAQFDARSLDSWVRSRNTTDLCKYAVKLQFATDNGVAAGRQSLLGVLAMIAGGGGKEYFTETERHRCKGGNQQLAQKLAQPIAGVFHLGLRVRGIRNSEDGSGMAVEALDPDNRKVQFTARDVILAIPPSVWGEIDFGDLLPIGPKPQMGKNVKCLMSFKTEFWKRSGLSPNLTSDRPLELTWQSTEEQQGPGHALAAFSGAEQAVECMRWQPEERTAAYVRELSRAYPGARQALVDARFKNWPDNPFVRASYAFPAPGEISRWGPVFEQGVGHLHFAGEHTCYAFVGYMEGALQSGIRACNRLMVRDGLAHSIS